MNVEKSEECKMKEICYIRHAAITLTRCIVQSTKPMIVVYMLKLMISLK